MTDVCRPLHHIRPRTGWINDPNGLAHVDGRWHVFFQYRADQPRHGEIAWGHVISDDLFAWREEPVALRPRAGEIDAVGCWSGCCTIDDGTPTLCYTAVPNSPEGAVGAIATGDATLSSWTPAEVPSAPRTGAEDAQTRDPFVVWIDGRRYIVQGHGGLNTPASLLLYDATDLTSWELLGPLLSHDDEIAASVAPADIWECPNVFQLDGRWVVLVSLWQAVDGRGTLAGVRWLVGEMDTTGDHPRFVPSNGGVLDDGPAFYAPQALVDDDRILMWGWSWELKRDEEWLDEHGWAGVLTAPRELHVVDGQLTATLAPEFASHAHEELGSPWSAAEGTCVLVTTSGPAVLVCDGADGNDRVELPGAASVLVDGSLVEVYRADGTTHTTRIYPAAGSTWRLEGAGTVQAIR